MKLSKYKTIVIKIGSSLIVNNKSKRMNAAWLKSLAKEIRKLRKQNVRVVVVSSGSIASASKKLGKTRKELSLEEMQAYASFGQALLIEGLRKIFLKSKIDIAQLLITGEDCQDRRRYLNMRSTLDKLLDMGILPIINENDTTATDEIKFGDNDKLSSDVAGLLSADLLVLLSDVDGLYDKNPKTDKSAKLINKVTKITAKIENLAAEDTSYFGTGGMKSKVNAAGSAMSGGIDVIITKGLSRNTLFGLEKKKAHTLFKASKKVISAKKKWLSQMKAKGKIKINKCAVDVLKKGGVSLLPIGVVGYSGSFKRGDVVEIVSERGKKIAQGIVGVEPKELKKIMGKSSDTIIKETDFPKRVIVVHCDNMV